MPKCWAGKKGKIVFRDTLGEFAVSALLRNVRAAKDKVLHATEHWAGDRGKQCSIAANSISSCGALARDSHSGAADDFVALYRPALQKMYGAAFGGNVTLSEQGSQVITSILH